MKKTLFLLASIFINISADSINSQLNEAIRSSDLEKVKGLIELEIFSEKEKKAYLELAEEILLVRIIRPSFNVPPFKIVASSGELQFSGGMACVYITVISGVYSNYNNAPFSNNDCRPCRFITPLAFISACLLFKKSYKMAMDYHAKINQLYKNAQEIKQLFLIS